MLQWTIVLVLTLLLPLVLSRGLFESDLLESRTQPLHLLAERAGALADAYLCANVAVTAPLGKQICKDLLGNIVNPLTAPIGLTFTCTNTTSNIVVDPSICLCLTAGVLTDPSLARLNATIKANGTGVSTLTTAVPGTFGYTATSLLNYINSTEPAILNTAGTNCTNYPTGSIPRDCGTCNYDCPANQYVCGKACVPNTKQCISGMPVRKRDEPGHITDMRCPKGRTACGLPKTSLRHGFECIDTKSDVESCGACAFPLPGRPVGKDCTAIDHTQSVLCTNGQCVVESCRRGWVVNGDRTRCLPDPTVTTGKNLNINYVESGSKVPESATVVVEGAAAEGKEDMGPDDNVHHRQFLAAKKTAEEKEAKSRAKRKLLAKYQVKTEVLRAKKTASGKDTRRVQLKRDTMIRLEDSYSGL